MAADAINDYLRTLDANALLVYEQHATPAVRLLVEELERHHPYSAAHSRRVAWLSFQCSLELEVVATDSLYRHALLHDVGKAEIPLRILDSARDLDDAELSLMRSHAVRGEDILRRRAFKDEASTARSHHERFSGGGYPDNLSGDEIPFFARVVAACDSFEAMIAPERAYRQPLTLAEARGALEGGSGAQFDPRVAAALDVVCLTLTRPMLTTLEASPASVQSSVSAPGIEA